MIWNLDEPSEVFKLEKPLREVSGLALDAQGRLLAHNDERGRIYVLDPGSGEIREEQKLLLGDRPIKGDFEGIARSGNRVWMINSRGVLLETNSDGTQVALFNTPLGKWCEIEGATFDAVTGKILVVCKTIAGGPKPLIHFYELEPDDHRQNGNPVQIDLRPLNLGYPLRPSGITISEDGQTLYILSSKPVSILEVTRQGKLVRYLKLSKKFHRQPEGIEILPDGRLAIADEGGDGRARLTLYPLVNGR